MQADVDAGRDVVDVADRLSHLGQGLLQFLVGGLEQLFAAPRVPRKRNRTAARASATTRAAIPNASHMKFCKW